MALDLRTGTIANRWQPEVPVAPSPAGQFDDSPGLRSIGTTTRLEDRPAGRLDTLKQYNIGRVQHLKVAGVDIQVIEGNSVVNVNGNQYEVGTEGEKPDFKVTVEPGGATVFEFD